MGKPVFLAADYLGALQALMPRGRVWPTEPGSVQAQALYGLMPVYERLSADALELLSDAFPSTTFQLLPEWEESLGLPDPCAGEQPTYQERRSQVLARFINTGGQSVGYFVAYAAALGYTVTISQFTPFRCGQQTCGDPLGGPEWAHTWAINAPLNTAVPFRAGQSGAGEPLEAFGNAVLQCELAEIAPAHTILQFRYH